MYVLGIETSCDETAVGVVDESGHIYADVIFSQVAMHAFYGGVVPEIASRAHIEKIYPVIAEALQQAQMHVADLDAIAVTVGPGLVGGLMVGLMAAKGLAYASQKPLIGIHHMEGHLMAPFLNNQEGFAYPFVALLVSGGHTQLLHVRQFGDYQILGQTLDDAVGEAFDKVARLLALPYPGGPAIAQCAAGGQANRIHFPRPMSGSDTLDFSFSGLKTAVRLFWMRQESKEALLSDVAAAFQEAVVDVLVAKSLAACQKMACRRLLVAGGVGANRRLRQRLTEEIQKNNMQLCLPSLRFCTDNGSMIAMAGVARYPLWKANNLALDVRPNWPITELDGGKNE